MNHKKIFAITRMSTGSTMASSLIKIRTTIQHLPWRFIGVVCSIIVLIGWSLFHFYFATPSRVINKFLALYPDYSVLVVKMDSTSAAIEQIELENIDTVVGQLNELHDLTKEAQALDLPAKFLASYALRGANSDVQQQLFNLYSVDSQQDIAVISENAKVLSVVLQTHRKLLEKTDIKKEDVEAYIQLLESEKANLNELDQSDDIRLEATRTLVDYLYESAILYRDTGDETNFISRQSNLNSELLKEFKVAWDSGTEKQRKNISTQKTALESLSILKIE